MNNRTVIALIASAILNVFCIGVGIGVVVTGARIVPAARARPMPNIWVAAMALPQPDRFKFRNMLRDKAAALQPKFKEIRAARQDSAALIAAPTVDAKALSAALVRARTGELDARAQFDEAFVAYLIGMPQAERAALASAMMRAGPRNVRQAIRAEDNATSTRPALPASAPSKSD